MRKIKFAAVLSKPLCHAVFVLSLLPVIAGCGTANATKSAGAKVHPENWKLGSSTSLIPVLKPEVIKEVRESGIHFIEIGWKDHNLEGSTFADRMDYAKSVFAQASAEGITIWSTHVPYGKNFDISNPDAAARKNTVALVKEYIDLAIEMRAKQIVLHPSEPLEESTRAQRIINCRESLQELAAYTKGKGIALAMECLPPNFLGRSSNEMLVILDGIEGVGVCFDSNHLYPEKPEEFVRKVGKRIRTVHIADFDGKVQKHWMPGRGAVDWNKVIDALADIGYSGPFMYEVVRRDKETHTFKDLKANFDSLRTAWSNSKTSRR
ncbi:sugar phosphate isomerase/epimerase family protein [Longitalea luteola]|uniref:sugar phosphate isomerase/epimerase family protein n=1 Tax=Longitalea luteola TaxID=2812563 RepID=UPI001A968F7F|nr:sugar phosphate isomerase/epimerase family protein [Longitalea luteola]